MPPLILSPQARAELDVLDKLQPALEELRPASSVALTDSPVTESERGVTLASGGGSQRASMASSAATESSGSLDCWESATASRNCAFNSSSDSTVPPIPPPLRVSSASSPGLRWQRAKWPRRSAGLAARPGYEGELAQRHLHGAADQPAD